MAVTVGLWPDRGGPGGTEVSGHPRDAQRGSVTLTTVGLLAPHLTAENHRDLLERARGKSKRAGEGLIAGLVPQPPVPAVVRRLPAGRRPASPSPVLAADVAPGAAGPVPAPPPAASPSPARPAAVAPP